MGSGAFLVEACRQLGDALVEAWHAHGEMPAIPPDEDEVIFARRLVAQRCLYGVDRNPVAVDLAKVSLWLVTLAKEHALTFVDHALRHGDSLVGLSRKQIEAFHWDADAPRFQAGFETMQVREHVGRRSPSCASGSARPDESVSDWELRDLWDEAQFELGKVRLFGDLVLAAFFEGEKPKEREAEAERVRERGRERRGRALPRLARGVAARRAAARAVPLGDRVPGGVRAGNAGVRRDRRQSAVLGGSTHLGSAIGAGYLDWLQDAARREPTATLTWSRTSSAAPSACCATRARSG